MGSRGEVNYRNPCLTMHQPWASLLVHGIKRIEGRSWPAPLRGRLWIHAAGKVPDPETIKAMEDFYREIYRLDGIEEDLKFPEQYPISQLLGCVDVVGCVKREELLSWEEIPEGVRLEGLTNFCWLCENPQKLLTPLKMRGNQGVFNLERTIYEAAVRGLSPVKGPLSVKFPLPDSRNLFSLKPGSLVSHFAGLKVSEVEKPPSLTTAIAGARAAATQFSKQQTYPTTVQHRDSTSRKAVLDARPQNGNSANNNREKYPTNSVQQRNSTFSKAVLDERLQNGNAAYNYREKYPSNSVQQRDSTFRKAVLDERHRNGNAAYNDREKYPSNSAQQRDSTFRKAVIDERPHNGNAAYNNREKGSRMVVEGHSSTRTEALQKDLNIHSGSPKIFAAAMKRLKPA